MLIETGLRTTSTHRGTLLVGLFLNGRVCERHCTLTPSLVQTDHALYRAINTVVFSVYYQVPFLSWSTLLPSTAWELKNTGMTYVCKIEKRLLQIVETSVIFGSFFVGVLQFQLLKSGVYFHTFKWNDSNLPPE